MLNDYTTKQWAIIFDTLNKNSGSSLPGTMTINGTTCHDKQVISDNFNRFFASIGEMNETNTVEHMDPSFTDYLTNQIDSNFAFPLINNRYKLKIIKDIKMSMSNSHDGILSELLKLVNDDIFSCIILIINQSLTTGIFPDKLKIVKVTPVYEKNVTRIS